MIQLERKKISPIIILIVLISITGLGYYILSVRLGINVYWSYKSNVLNSSGIVEQTINYSKDIFILLWAASYNLPKVNHGLIEKNLFLAGVIIIYGGILLFISGYGFSTFVAGIRAYIYVYIVYNYSYEKTFDIDFWKQLTNTLMILMFIQFAAVMYQWMRLGFSVILGSGGNRAIGLFTNAGSLGAFCMGVAAVLSYVYTKFRIIGSIKYIIFMLITCTVAFTSGGRGAFICSAGWLLIALITRMNISEKEKIIIIPVILIAVIPNLLDVLVSAVDRGDLMVSGSGRFEMWSILLNYNPLQLIFGQGLGVATNTASSLGSSDIAMDSTFTTVIMQYGVIGFLAFCGFLINRCILIYRNNSEEFWFSIYFIALLFALLFSGNILEMYGFSVLYTIVFCELLKENITENMDVDE